MTPQAPRVPEELVAQRLPEGDASGDFELDGARIETDGATVAAESVEVAESDLTGVAFDADAVQRLDVHDSVLRTCDLSNVTTRKCSLRRVELRQSRCVGLALPGADLQDVLVAGGTMMLASFAEARLQRVVFEEVNLREASFADTRLDDVAFVGCALTGADFRGARLQRCLMRGTALDGLVGIESLRGLTMPWPDLVASTRALAGALGISVEAD